MKWARLTRNHRCALYIFHLYGCNPLLSGWIIFVSSTVAEYVFRATKLICELLFANKKDLNKTWMMMLQLLSFFFLSFYWSSQQSSSCSCTFFFLGNSEKFGTIPSIRFSLLSPQVRLCLLLWPVWPVKSCQMSIKVAQKLFHWKNERFWFLYKNCLKCGRFGQNNCFHRLWKVTQRAINCPIWSHGLWHDWTLAASMGEIFVMATNSTIENCVWW